MKRKIIQLGPRNKLNLKYLNGRFQLSVFVLKGTPEEVEAAEAIRMELLERETQFLYDYYTAMPRLELNKLLEAHGVKRLSEMLELLVKGEHALLLSIAFAKELLRIADELRDSQNVRISLSQACDHFNDDAAETA